MTLRKYWGGCDEGLVGRLLGFKSINLAKQEPEEMSSLLRAFTEVCCYRALTWRRHVFIWHQSALCLRWQKRIGATVTHLWDRKKTFCLTKENTSHLSTWVEVRGHIHAHTHKTKVIFKVLVSHVFTRLHNTVKCSPYFAHYNPVT